jgi:hypothetical protein
MNGAFVDLRKIMLYYTQPPVEIGEKLAEEKVC